eukprot:scaffold82856_cov18-Prasinocladus_malaysianus.AAC.1
MERRALVPVAAGSCQRLRRIVAYGAPDRTGTFIRRSRSHRILAISHRRSAPAYHIAALLQPISLILADSRCGQWGP